MASLPDEGTVAAVDENDRTEVVIGVALAVEDLLDVACAERRVPWEIINAAGLWRRRGKRYEESAVWDPAKVGVGGPDLSSYVEMSRVLVTVERPFECVRRISLDGGVHGPDGQDIR